MYAVDAHEPEREALGAALDDRPLAQHDAAGDAEVAVEPPRSVRFVRFGSFVRSFGRSFVRSFVGLKKEDQSEGEDGAAHPRRWRAPLLRGEMARRVEEITLFSSR